MTLQGESTLLEPRLDKDSKGVNLHNSYFYSKSTKKLLQVCPSNPYVAKYRHNLTNLQWFQPIELLCRYKKVDTFDRPEL